MRDLYVCTHPVDARERLQEEIDRFYRGGEGRGWLVDNPRPGRFYAAPYEKEGYHRVLLRKLVSNSTVEVFYADFGTVAVVSISRLRFLHLDFLQPPAMAIQVRLWGLRGGGKSKLLEVLSEGNLREGDLLARVEEAGDKPAIWLIDNTLPGGRSLNLQLVTEGASKWFPSDLKKLGSDKKGVSETEEEAGGESRGSSAELESVIELQMALVSLMLESSLKTELMGKLVEAKRNLEVDFSTSMVLASRSDLVKRDDVPRSEARRILEADTGIEEPELESCAAAAGEHLEQKQHDNADGVQI